MIEFSLQQNLKLVYNGDQNSEPLSTGGYCSEVASLCTHENRDPEMVDVVGK